MAQGDGGATFTVDGNTLEVDGEIGPEDEARYSEHLFQLLSSGGFELRVDLTDLQYVNSTLHRGDVALRHDGQAEQKSVTVVASKEVARVMSIVGLDRMIDVEVP